MRGQGGTRGDEGAERDHVRWHDLECGGYVADLAVWRELADTPPAGTVLDLGAGTGRVALDLARAGHRVVAVDHDPVLVAELERRARVRRLRLETRVGDLRALDVGVDHAHVLVPMQTVQLLGGAAGRAAFLRQVPRLLRPGGRCAMALVEAPEPFDEEDAVTVPPDMRDHAGTVYASRPVRVAVDAERIVLDRVREIVDAHGERRVSDDRTVLDVVPASTLEDEARAAGLVVHRRLEVPATDEHVASLVVVVGA